MKITLTYNIEDANGKVLFKFPANTVLEKITDVWPLIMNYYESFYPIMIGGQCGKYRDVTIKEFKTNKFIKLFSDMYQENRILMNTPNIERICVGRHPLSANDKQIYLSGHSKKITYDHGGQLFDMTNEVEKICINESVYYSGFGTPIMVLSDMIFD